MFQMGWNHQLEHKGHQMFKAPKQIHWPQSISSTEVQAEFPNHRHHSATLPFLAFSDLVVFGRWTLVIFEGKNLYYWNNINNWCFFIWMEMVKISIFSNIKILFFIQLKQSFVNGWLSGSWYGFIRIIRKRGRFFAFRWLILQTRVCRFRLPSFMNYDGWLVWCFGRW